MDGICGMDIDGKCGMDMDGNCIVGMLGICGIEIVAHSGMDTFFSSGKGDAQLGVSSDKSREDCCVPRARDDLRMPLVSECSPSPCGISPDDPSDECRLMTG